MYNAETAGPSEIGVATPYAGQVNKDLEFLRKVQKDRPDHDWRSLRFGTTEWFMGREALYMIVALVRGSNDHGELGFMSDGSRLNVLLSRQKQALVIFGDKELRSASGFRLEGRGRTGSQSSQC